MADLSRVTQMLEELRKDVDRVIAEVSGLQENEGGAGRQEEQEGDANDGDREAEVLRQNAEKLPGVFLPKTQDGVLPIVGGEPTKDFPDCCAVGSANGYTCSGTLIAPNLVITARHCNNVTRVFLKGWDVEKLEQGEVIEVDKNIRHPQFDIRVLVLKNNSTVTPRPVARGAAVGNPQEATLVGFGNIDTDGRIGYGLKRMVKVPITSISCATDEEVTEFGCRLGKEIVAGHRGLLKDSCHGDSGGPLYIRNSLGGYDLLGATSRGLGGTGNACGDGGIYVRVDQFLDWIQQETGIKV